MINDTAAEDSCSDLWFIPRNGTGTCHCGNTVHDTVTCNDYTKEVTVLSCYCMTDDSVTNQTVFGACLFNCNFVSKNYHEAPTTCKNFGRKGTLCGECITRNDTFLQAYSYDMYCVQCTHSHSWWKYIAAAFLPLTAFIVVILACRISVVSPQLHSFVFFAQIISTPINVRALLLMGKQLSPAWGYLIKIYAAAYGMWNLDFFRTLILGICLHLSTLQVLALDYLVAVYPMLLMVIAYALVELHGYGFRPVLAIWRPFHCISARFRRGCNIQTSIVDAFVTFFILSTTKMFSVSYDLLIPTRLYNASGESVGLRLFYDPNIVYMGRQHLKYALLAIAVFSLFILFPLVLLIVSPLHCVEKYIVVRARVVKEFLKSFQRYYKDGKNGTTNHRWYASFYHVIFFFTFLTYSLTLSIFAYHFLVFVSVSAAIVVLTAEPYKEEYANYNIVDALVFLNLALFCLSMSIFSGLLNRVSLYLTTGVILSVGTVPVAYIAAVVIFWIWKRFCAREDWRVAEDSLPHRLTHSSVYRHNNF